MFKRGVTILEVVVVIAVLAVLFIVSANILSGGKKNINLILQKAAITTNVEYARQQALTSSDDVEILFDEGKYILQTAQKTIQEYKLEPGYTTDLKKLGFTSQGTPKYSGTVYLYYKGRKVAKFTLAPATGLLAWKNP